MIASLDAYSDQSYPNFVRVLGKWYMLEQKYFWGGLCSAWTVQNPSHEDIQWFKDEMHISPKYIEGHEGILGMSWLHFLVMVLLIVFFIGALIAMYIRHKRTKQILTSLLQEEINESKS